MTIAVIYTRVSSKSQVKKGDGLASQESRCREFAAYKGHDVVEVFRDEGVSGGLVDRPAMKEMLGWLRKRRAESPVVLIDDISRLARGLDAHIQLRGAIGSVGARLESPSIEFGEDSDSQLIENMLASVSQHHRQKNGEQVRHRMTARLKAGYFTFWTPTGYTYVAAKGQGKVLVRDEPHASLIQEALEGFASGRFQTQAEVKRFLEPHDIFARDRNGEIHPQRIRNMLLNKLYAGYYEYRPWGVGLTKGRHPALISWETFQRIQERLAERAVAPVRADSAEEFPLRGFVTCACCGHSMTAYWAKGRNRRYPYYECFNKACGERRKSIRRDVLENDFANLLRQLRPSDSLMTIAAAMFRDIWEHRAQAANDRRVEQKQALPIIERDIARTVDRLVATESEAAVRALEIKLEKLEAKKARVAEALAGKPSGPKSFDAGFRTAMTFLAIPWKLWESNRPEDRQTVLKLVFADPLPYARNRGFRTAKTTLPFKVLGDLADPEGQVAEGVGFEPTGPLRAQRFSRPPHSTALPPFRWGLGSRSRRARPESGVTDRGEGRRGLFPRARRSCSFAGDRAVRARDPGDPPCGRS
tara:strand:- start:153 stop:1913 length:1761 start_codon:yes stop_codon:yes gene_type:complete